MQKNPYLQIGTAKGRRHEAVSVLWLFLAVPLVGLQSVIVELSWSYSLTFRVAKNMFSNINISKLISKFCDRLSNLPANAVE